MRRSAGNPDLKRRVCDEVIMGYHVLTRAENSAKVLGWETTMTPAKPKRKSPEPKNPLLGVRLPQEYIDALEEIARERNEENAKDLDSSYLEVTAANLTRALIKKFLVEQGKIKP